MTAKRWYFQNSEGTEFGSFSSNELRILVQSGRILRKTLLRADTSQVWVIAERVKGLFDNEPEQGPKAPQAVSGSAPRIEATPPPNVELTRGSAANHPQMSGLATGEIWDNLSEYLGDRSSQPQATEQIAVRPIASGDSDAKHTVKPIPEFVDFSGTLDDRGIKKNQAIIFRLLVNPRDAFGQVLEPGMLSYAIGMIAASAVLYLLMCLPFLYGAEILREGTTKNMRALVVRNVPMFPNEGIIPQFPGVARVPVVVKQPEAEETFSGILSRVLSLLQKFGPGFLLSAGLTLGAIGSSGTIAAALFATDPRPQPIRRGITALGFSLTPLVCILSIALPTALLMGLFAKTIALLCIPYGIFVTILYYHEALQAIGGVPLKRAVYCTPVIFAIGTFLFLVCSLYNGVGLITGWLPF